MGFKKETLKVEDDIGFNQATLEAQDDMGFTQAEIQIEEEAQIDEEAEIEAASPTTPTEAQIEAWWPGLAAATFESSSMSDLGGGGSLPSRLTSSSSNIKTESVESSIQTRSMGIPSSFRSITCKRQKLEYD